jgi:hypothetical protein
VRDKETIRQKRIGSERESGQVWRIYRHRRTSFSFLFFISVPAQRKQVEKAAVIQIEIAVFYVLVYGGRRIRSAPPGFSAVSTPERAPSHPIPGAGPIAHHLILAAAQLFLCFRGTGGHR